MKILSLFIFTFIFYLTTSAQVARLSLKNGANYNFKFNSFQKYTDGFMLEDYTRLEVFWDENTTGLNWHLEVKEEDNDADANNIIGANGNAIALTDLCITAADIAGPDNCTNYYTLSPTTNFQEIINLCAAGATPGYTDNVKFTFYFGDPTAPAPCASNHFEGKPADFYSFEIIFELSAE